VTYLTFDQWSSLAPRIPSAVWPAVADPDQTGDHDA
jgi:hypothetical protein